MLGTLIGSGSNLIVLCCRYDRGRQKQSKIKMAAPTHDANESVRIRIKLDTSKKNATTVSTQFWMLVQESPTLSTISDLEMQIVDQFKLTTHSIQLCLERFLLPSWESVRILRENDLLRYTKWCPLSSLHGIMGHYSIRKMYMRHECHIKTIYKYGVNNPYYHSLGGHRE